MSPRIERLLAELKKGLTELYGLRLKAVYLYGSYARGHYNQNSDLDVMIVLDNYTSYWDELVYSAELASNLSLEYDVTSSRMIMTEGHMEEGRSTRAKKYPRGRRASIKE